MKMEGFYEQRGIIPNGLEYMFVLGNGLDDWMPVPRGHFYNPPGLPYVWRNAQACLLY
jgi:hypothetical protein